MFKNTIFSKKTPTFSALNNFKDDEVHEVWRFAGGGDCKCIRCQKEREEEDKN